MIDFNTVTVVSPPAFSISADCPSLVPYYFLFNFIRCSTKKTKTSKTSWHQSDTFIRQND